MVGRSGRIVRTVSAVASRRCRLQGRPFRPCRSDSLRGRESAARITRWPFRPCRSDSFRGHESASPRSQVGSADYKIGRSSRIGRTVSAVTSRRRGLQDRSSGPYRSYSLRRKARERPSLGGVVVEDGRERPVEGRLARERPSLGGVVVEDGRERPVEGRLSGNPHSRAVGWRCAVWAIGRLMFRVA
ncbi:hypothetical protein PUN28_008320 [Cardiocondyla obscurior]|uniref:Uncharacterized protein n=1 Tax=Cardiocondyla obscurior TaxID=286306 RepID=A0AAW2FZ19_9HYME